MLIGASLWQVLGGSGVSVMMIHNFGFFFQVEKKAAKTTAVLILSNPESKLESVEFRDGKKDLP